MNCGLIFDLEDYTTYPKAKQKPVFLRKINFYH
uniref:Uncharacterized protein n=1 Tax=Anguilla anguilla TaxID=7936 RepID=A0A0E9PRK3_ANGAN